MTTRVHQALTRLENLKCKKERNAAVRTDELERFKAGSRMEAFAWLPITFSLRARCMSQGRLPSYLAYWHLVLKRCDSAHRFASQSYACLYLIPAFAASLPQAMKGRPEMHKRLAGLQPGAAQLSLLHPTALAQHMHSATNFQDHAQTQLQHAAATSALYNQNLQSTVRDSFPRIPPRSPATVPPSALA